jgi:hypothetical protein
MSSVTRSDSFSSMDKWIAAVTKSDSFSSTDNWITPEEQVEEILDQIPDEEIEETELAKTISTVNQLIPQKLIVRYAGLDYLDPKYSMWRTSLKALNVLPAKAPRLEPTTFKTSEKDEETYLVKQVVLLIPSELNDLETFQKVIKAYGSSTLQEKSPLNLTEYLSDPIPEEFRTTTLPPTQWVVVTGVLGFFAPLQRGLSDLMHMVVEPDKETLETYTIPSLEIASIAALLHFIATGKSLYENIPITVPNKTFKTHGILTNQFDSTTAKAFFNTCNNYCQNNHDTAVYKRIPTITQKH